MTHHLIMPQAVSSVLESSLRPNSCLANQRKVRTNSPANVFYKV